MQRLTHFVFLFAALTLALSGRALANGDHGGGGGGGGGATPPDGDNDLGDVDCVEWDLVGPDGGRLDAGTSGGGNDAGTDGGVGHYICGKHALGCSSAGGGAAPMLVMALPLLWSRRAPRAAAVRVASAAR
jgi:hypothetical protein